MQSSATTPWVPPWTTSSIPFGNTVRHPRSTVAATRRSFSVGLEHVGGQKHGPTADALDRFDAARRLFFVSDVVQGDVEAALRERLGDAAADAADRAAPVTSATGA